MTNSSTLNGCSARLFDLPRYQLYRHQRNERERGPDHKRNAIVDHPQQTTNHRKHHRANMIDREPNRHGGGDVSRVTDFLEECSDGNGEVEKDMIGDIQHGDNQF